MALSMKREFRLRDPSCFWLPCDFDARCRHCFCFCFYSCGGTCRVPSRSDWSDWWTGCTFLARFVPLASVRERLGTITNQAMFDPSRHSSPSILPSARTANWVPFFVTMTSACGLSNCPLGRLSNEILLIICSLLKEPSLGYDWISRYRSLQSLQSFSLTCHAIRASCLPTLFHTVAIKHDWNYASMDLGEMLECEMLGHYARWSSFMQFHRQS